MSQVFSPALQQRYLQLLQEHRVSTSFFLLNGVKLQGIVLDFDEDIILLGRESQMQLIFKHSIATIMPSKAISHQDLLDFSLAL